MIEIKKIQNVKLHHDFYLLSEKFGYTSDIILDYIEDISELIELWTTNQYVEIYSDDKDKKWGRIKSSSAINAKTQETSAGAIPYYIGVFHSRVLKNANDPLLLITFENEDLMIRMFTDHDEMFGSVAMKNNPSLLKKIKKNISDLLNQSTSKGLG